MCAVSQAMHYNYLTCILSPNISKSLPEPLQVRKGEKSSKSEIIRLRIIVSGLRRVSLLPDIFS